MNARRMLTRCADDAAGRLRWVVLQRLGICPASLRGRLLGRRAAMRFACQLILDGGKDAGAQTGTNPNFDMRRYEALAGGSGT